MKLATLTILITPLTALIVAASRCDYGAASSPTKTAYAHVAGEQQRLGVGRLHRLRRRTRATSARTGSRSLISRVASWFFARFLPMIFVLAIAGSLVASAASAGAGTLRTDTPTFGFLLGGVVLLVGALTFVPTSAPRPTCRGPDRPALLTCSQHCRSATVAIVLATLVFGLAYPLAVTGIGQVAFPGAPTATLRASRREVVGWWTRSRSRCSTRPASRRSTPTAPQSPSPIRATCSRAPSAQPATPPTRRTSPTAARTRRSPRLPERGRRVLALERPYVPGLQAGDFCGSGRGQRVRRRPAAPAYADLQSHRIARQRGISRAAVLD